MTSRAGRRPPRKTNRAGAASNRPFSRGHLCRILGNAIYVGRISHKGQVFEGEHPAIVDEAIWQQVQERLASNRQGTRRRANTDTSSLLTELVFDAQGNRITPSHTAKGSKRYRYYAGPVNKDDEAGTLRVPAQELDGAVVAAALSAFLCDEARVLDAIGGSDLHEVQRVLRTAKDLAAAMGDGAEIYERADAVHALVQRVIVHPSHLQIRLRAEAFDLRSESNLDQERLSIDMPLQIKRSGMVSRLIIGGSAVPMRRPDPKLIALVAKAQDWFDRLRSGKSSSVDTIAQTEGISGSYVTRLIYLAFLAPDIVERIRRGDQPVELTIDRIQRLVPLPACWKAQRTLLGIEG